MYAITLNFLHSPQVNLQLFALDWVIALMFGPVGALAALSVLVCSRLLGSAVRTSVKVLISTLMVSAFVILGPIAPAYNFRQALDLVALSSVISLPIGLLIGSSVNPVDLFTFGNMDGYDAKPGQPSFRHVLETVFSLPLRLLSIVGLGSWLFYLASEWSKQRDLATFVFGSPPAIYLALSAFLTFRSPYKLVLALIAVLMNLPVAMVALVCYAIGSNFYQLGNTPTIIAYVLGVFLLAWLVFLFARLTLKTTPEDAFCALNINELSPTRDLGNRLSESVDSEVNYICQTSVRFEG
jgi:hypothetical protein